MNKYYLFILSLLFWITAISQQITKSKWNDDLDELQRKILQKEYLFHHFSKKKFKTEIKYLKQKSETYDNKEFLWSVTKLLSRFKLLNLNVLQSNLKQYPFDIKVFNKRPYLIKIDRKNSYLLEFELVKINDFSITEIINKLKTIFYLPHNNTEQKVLEKWVNNKSLLKYLNITNQDTLKLTFKSNKGDLEVLKLPFNENLDHDLLATLKSEKKIFNQRKKNTWFWKYGINFGKQVFLKYQVCSSKEHINRLKDSLKITEQAYAKMFKIPLQQVYNALEFNQFLKKVAKKFKKRRYNKLIIDLRNNTKGAFLNSEKLISTVKKIKRINRKGRLFILTDNNTNAAAINTILAFIKQTKVKLIGQETFGTKEDSNQTSSFELKNSKLAINFPLEYQKEVTILPNILVEPTLNQYKKGVDSFLQTVLDY